MTTLLERALEAVKRMPPQDQDAIAGVMLSMSGIDTDETVDPEELRDALAGLAQVDRGEIASAEEVDSAFRRFRR